MTSVLTIADGENKQPEAGGEGSCSMCEALSRSINSKALEFAKMNALIVTQMDEYCTPKHADQLATREAKKEHQAYEEQMSRDEERIEAKGSPSRSNGQVTPAEARRQEDIRKVQAVVMTIEPLAGQSGRVS